MGIVYIILLPYTIHCSYYTIGLKIILIAFFTRTYIFFFFINSPLLWTLCKNANNYLKKKITTVLLFNNRVYNIFSRIACVFLFFFFFFATTHTYIADPPPFKEHYTLPAIL